MPSESASACGSQVAGSWHCRERCQSRFGNCDARCRGDSA
ncbi:hypothetical protein LC55x_3248 [Lysobacter capsici]|nr:hypothetical protein LC55x_3248 [Lysobacter capsici]